MLEPGASAVGHMAMKLPHQTAGHFTQASYMSWKAVSALISLSICLQGWLEGARGQRARGEDCMWQSVAHPPSPFRPPPSPLRLQPPQRYFQSIFAMCGFKITLRINRIQKINNHMCLLHFIILQHVALLLCVTNV